MYTRPEHLPSHFKDEKLLELFPSQILQNSNSRGHISLLTLNYKKIQVVINRRSSEFHTGRVNLKQQQQLCHTVMQTSSFWPSTYHLLVCMTFKAAAELLI